jgi:hypothetical protein
MDHLSEEHQERLSEEDQDRFGDPVIKWVHEMAHRRRMLLEGNKYARMRLPYMAPEGPALDYLLIGQLPMRLTQAWNGVPKAVTLTEKRVGWPLERSFEILFRDHKPEFGLY